MSLFSINNIVYAGHYLIVIEFKKQQQMIANEDDKMHEGLFKLQKVISNGESMDIEDSQPSIKDLVRIIGLRDLFNFKTNLVFFPQEEDAMKIAKEDSLERDDDKEKVKVVEVQKPQDKSRPVSSTPVPGTPWYLAI